MFKRILVPTDGSKLSQKAVRRAVALAKVTRADLVALHVLPRFSDSRTGFFGAAAKASDSTYYRQAKAEAQRWFTAIKQQADRAGVKFEGALIESNDVWNAIISAASKKRCDLICMASHGRRGLSGIVLGSETNKVLTHSRVAVLVLR